MFKMVTAPIHLFDLVVVTKSVFMEWTRALMSMSLHYQSYETDIVNRENFFSNDSSLTSQQKLKEKLGDEISSTILVLNLERT